MQPTFPSLLILQEGRASHLAFGVVPVGVVATTKINSVNPPRQNNRLAGHRNVGFRPPTASAAVVGARRGRAALAII